MTRAWPIVLAACGGPTSTTAPSRFDTVIAHAHVHGAPDADAIALAGGTIAAVGRADRLACAPPCTLVDAAGGYVVPGFHDAHVHPYNAGRESFQLVVSGGDARAIGKRVAAWAKAHPDDKWIVGRGFSMQRMTPTHELLDEVEPIRPVVLTDHTGHTIWCNAAALTAAGVDRTTRDPPNGRIVRDAAGEPTGVLHDGAKALVVSHEPPESLGDMRRAIVAGQAALLAHGITAQQGGPVTLDVARAYIAAETEGALVQRSFLWAPLGVGDPVFATWTALARSQPATARVQIVAFKGYVDGVFASRTAALLAPYADAPETSGALYVQPARLAALVARANRAGFPVVIHAIGDAAIRAALDAFERARGEVGAPRLPNRVEHVSLLDDHDAPRFARLGVWASVQPGWLAGYRSRAAFTLLERVGPERARELYAWKTLADAGATLVFGSDLPSGSDVDPIVGVHAAAARAFVDGDVLAPEQRLPIDDAMRAYTELPARAIGWGDRLGRIAPGYAADVVLYERDPARATSGADAHLLGVWIAGARVK